MSKIPVSYIVRDTKHGGLIGIGVGLTISIAAFGLHHDPLWWLSNIIFGFLVGVLMTIGIESTLNLIYKFFPDYYKPLFPLLAVIYIVSTVIFYGCSTLFNLINAFFLAAPFLPPAAIFDSSLGIGIAGVMISFFFIHAYENEEMLHLELENRKLAIIEERNRIARELHDSVSQNLFGISLHLNTLEVILEKDAVKAREITLLLRGMVEEVQAEMRLMVHELRPAALSEKGFFEAMESLVRIFRVRYNLDITCNIYGDENINSATQMVLYRVLQEALNNVVKHANAEKVRVVLTVRNNSGELVIQDNGQGFLPGDIVQNGRIGIVGMKERVAQVKGVFNLQSTLGQGTTITVKF